jgi:hypothetical protein
MATDMPPEDEIDRLRAELEEWRRRAEVAEAVAAERLARAENAERAVRAAEAALATRPIPPLRPSPDRTGAAPTAEGETPGSEPAGTAEPKRPASLLERWRRYTETIN